ncbi:ArsR family transcriptional regulator [Sinomonas atrocyanea]|uniref:ArsR family transcriptional regulator n=1 Tax=Sinomonas atrocyanea TaxID=37927 RepID=A0A126ZUU8_9MICC|nr:metalloregulator ArsR/SmtB family transcription factor [Sinomonas atrocyanea]AMM30737.1 ArsR family transcriptional regulator [Sinomonas atrocyanea]GEB63783.1 transcriptional regulator [Sinomonas atrocyanea]GGG74356.1 transcriptional regulator [Sinomonas atrocyanea]
MHAAPPVTPTEEDQLNRAFAALADPLRRRLVARLALGDATVNELAAPFAVTLQAVSKHLRVLEDAGLITRSRDAQRRPCHLEPTAFGPLAAWIDAYRVRTEEKYRRLDAVLAAQAEHEGGREADQTAAQQRGHQP